ncbi:MAG: reverse transcriptase/maturase family protein [bacterium]|nr:reverse transcriptase/maturase family protein [bacterium]
MASEDITREHMIRAWYSFARGKSHRADVAAFAFDLETNLQQLYHDLTTGRYRHGRYRMFTRCDPKPRAIAVPSVRDQVVHHLLVTAIGPFFERRFHPHSYASRPRKGVLAAVETVQRWIASCSDGGRTSCFALRMDVRRFFASVDHRVLLALLAQWVPAVWMYLCVEVLRSFETGHPSPSCSPSPRGRGEGEGRHGIPLGNLTSQLFANVYLHELDRVVAHDLHVRHYARYMDDWVVVGRDPAALHAAAQHGRTFLRDALRLDAPPEKTSIVPVTRGVDWLGFRIFPHHRVLRPTTVRHLRRRIHHRVFAALDGDPPHDRLHATFASYDGLLRTARSGREREFMHLLERCVD